jgi:hypothetical protein
MYCHVMEWLNGGWIGNWIYRTLLAIRDYALQITVPQRLMFLLTDFTALLGNVFQQWRFLYSRADVQAGWRPSHTNLLLF